MKILLKGYQHKQKFISVKLENAVLAAFRSIIKQICHQSYHTFFALSKIPPFVCFVR